MSQLSYSADQEVGVNGALADTTQIKDVRSLYNADSDIKFGKFVTKGTGDFGCKQPAAATDITDEKLARGVALMDPTTSYPSSGDPLYPQKSAVNVCRKGRVWVKVEDTITVGTSTVNVRYGGTGDKGSFRGAAVADETAVLPKAKWVTAATAGNLAQLEIDL